MLVKRLTMKWCVFIINEWTFLYLFHYFYFGNTHTYKQTHTHTHTQKRFTQQPLMCARAPPQLQVARCSIITGARDWPVSPRAGLSKLERVAPPLFRYIWPASTPPLFYTVRSHSERRCGQDRTALLFFRTPNCVFTRNLLLRPARVCCSFFPFSFSSLWFFYFLQWRPAHQFALIRFLLAAVSSPCVIWRSPADAKWKRRIFSVCSTTWTTVTADSSAWCPLFRRIRKSVKWRSSSMSLTISWTCSWRWRRTRLSWNRRAHPPPHGPLSHKSTQSR